MDGQKQFLKEVLQYNRDVNDELIDMFNDDTDAKARSLFDHMLNAHDIWNHRMLNKPPMYGIWQGHKLHEYHHINEHNHETSCKIIDDCEMYHLITYTNSKGKNYRNSIGDILFHIANHSTYHRAQIATIIRDSGMPPLVSDFVHYKRKFQ